MVNPVYLDHAATTPPAAEVIDAMLPWLTAAHANPHADHQHGQRAAAAVEQARSEVADLIGAESEEIVFTSGATESNNLALHGFFANPHSSRTLALAPTAHKSVLEVARVLAERGTKVIELPIGPNGGIVFAGSEAALRAAGTPDAGLVTLTHGNNELGTIQSIAQISSLAHQIGFLVHVDAAQTAGKVPIDVGDDEIDLASISSHKMYGPVGIGALYVARGAETRLSPLMHGGGQEKGLRPGTVPVFLAVGFGTAARIAKRSMAEDARQLAQLADQFLQSLRGHNVEFEILGDSVHRLPGHLSLRLPGTDAEALLSSVSNDLSASTGSACTAGQLGASHVLRAIGLDEARAGEVIRITLGRDSCLADVERAVVALEKGIARQRAVLAR